MSADASATPGTAMSTLEFTPLPVPASIAGESPFWHPREQALYWVDIAGHKLNRFVPATAAHASGRLPPRWRASRRGRTAAC